MSSFCDARRPPPSRREGYDSEHRYFDSSDSRTRMYESVPINGQGPFENSDEMMYERKGRCREEVMRDFGDLHQRTEDESDEEGEVKEAGSTRDLREEIEAKRVRRQGPRPVVMGPTREDSMNKMRSPAGCFDGMAGPRREVAMDDPPEMNGGPMNRRGEWRRDFPPPHNDVPRSNGPLGMEFRKSFSMDEGDLGAMRRRAASPDVFRSREGGPVIRRPSPSRRPSPGIRRSLGRSSSPPIRRMAAFHPEHRHSDGRYFGDCRGVSREPRENEFRDHQSPGHFGPAPGPGYMRDGAPLGASRTSTIRLRNLPHMLPVERLKGDLFEDCVRHGRVLDIGVEFRGNDRHALVTFAEPVMAEDARRHMHRTSFHGSQLDVELEFSSPPRASMTEVRRKPDDRDAGPPHGHDIRSQPFQDEMDDPCSNCRIFVDDLDERVPDAEVLNTFRQFGSMEAFDVQRDRGRAWASIRFRTLSSAVRARREMNGQRIGDRRCKIDYRFGEPSCELWIGGVHVSVTEADLSREFSRFGRICKVLMNRANKCAFVLFDRVEEAVEAASYMRGRAFGSANWKLKIDFADRSMVRSHSPGRGPFGGRLPGGKSVGSNGGGGSGSVGGGSGQFGRSDSHESAADVDGARSHPGGLDERRVSPSVTGQPGGHSEGGGGTPACSTGGNSPTAPGAHSAGSKRPREGTEPAPLEKKQLSSSDLTSRRPSDPPAPVTVNGHGSFDGAVPARRRSGGVPELDVTTPCATPHVNPSPTAASVAGPPVAAAQVATEGDEASVVAALGPSSADPLDRFPVLWRGQAVVKGAAAAVVLRSLTCEAELAGAMLPSERVTMTQRMRLGEDQMKEFGARLEATAAACRGVLLAVPASADDGVRLQQHFVAYLLERNAAGVVQLDAATLYLFPPGSALAREYQKSADIDLSLHSAYLLVVLLQNPP